MRSSDAFIVSNPEGLAVIESNHHSDYDIMRMHVKALFRHDTQLRLTSENVPNGGPAPRFFLGRTADGNVWRFHADLPSSLVNGLEKLCGEEPVEDELQKHPRHRDKYIELLEDYATVESVRAGPAYSFPENVASPSRGAIKVTEKHAELLRSGLEEWIPDVPSTQPFWAIVEENRVVSVCGSVRKTTEVHEAGVETATEARGNGYATAAVSAWANEVKREGCIPLYSTSWENTASQALANRLSLNQYGIDFYII